jgi:hypothetical protein
LLKRTRKGTEVAFSFFKNIQTQTRIQKYVNSSLKFHFLKQEIYTGHESLSTSTEGLRYEFSIIQFETLVRLRREMHSS